ncbi:filamentous hemagglutinin N-terminal domain-containing protein [Steroidobacter flavus]|uniref:Filamentous hemagglutinin N-terminal domain-containing protein n=1 Tax=Steroidobacter flavus TaxID=1842136 RepID=A0ABV8T5F4_9GAMM
MNRISAAVALALASSAALAAEPAVGTLPSGGQVIRGNASITQTNSQLDIHQSSDRAVINWQRFDIGRDATVNFLQPSASSVTLNRVLSSDPSAIFGLLNANGQVFISNPNGVLFGSSARVDVGGLVATSLQIDPDDFIAGNYRFTNGSGAVINQGTLTAKDGGYIALLAPEVRNEGVLSARLGTVAIAAGEAVTLNLDGSQLLSVQVDPATVDVLLENRHLIAAEGGQVILSASAAQRLVDGAISGATGATGLVVENGQARLVNVEGTVRAANVSIDGGAVGVTRVAGNIDAQTSSGNGGQVLVTGDKVHVDAGATIDASGNQGGTILIGGDQQGANPNVRNAQRLFVDADAAIHADGGAGANGSGDGGRVITYSTEATQVYGALTARGGAAGGDGGFIETSGGWFDLGSSIPDASAAAGRAGQWLIDPHDLRIDSAGPDFGITGDPNWTTTAIGSTLTTSSITNALNAGTSVTITTAAAGAERGDISVMDSIVKSAGGNASLSLFAHGHILVANGVQIESTSNRLDVTLHADQGNTGNGGIRLGVGTAILSNGGNILLRGGDVSFADPIVDPTVNPTLFQTQMQSGAARNGVTQYGVYLNGSTLQASGGNIEVRGVGSSGNAGVRVDNGATISTSGLGSIALYGLGGSGGANSDGVRITGSGTTVTSGSGDVRIYGLGRGGSGCFAMDCSDGVQIDAGATVSSTDGDIYLRGVSQSASYRGRGVWIDTNGSVRTNNIGDIDVIGIGGGPGGHSSGVHLTDGALIQTSMGDITVTGRGAADAGANNEGVKVDDSAIKVLSGAGNELTVDGYGGGGDWYNIGVNVRLGGVISTGSGGTMFVRGTGGTSNTGTGNWGILIEGDGTYESTGSGRLIMEGISGAGVDNTGIRVTGGYANRIGSSTMTGDITLIADSMNLADGSSNGLTVQSSGTLYITPRSAATTIGLGNGATGTLNLDNAELSRLTDGFYDIVIGMYTGTGAIDVRTVTFNDSLQLQNMGSGSQGMTIHGALDVGSNTLTLASQGGVTQTAGIFANELMLFGEGPYVLTNTTNEVGTLGGSLTGSLHFVNNGSFTVGSVLTGHTQWDGLYSTNGELRLEARGIGADLTLTRSMWSGTTGTAIELSADGAFINNAGANAVETTAGRTLVWSADRARTDLGGLAFDFKQYRATYGVDSPAQSTGNGILFQDAPTLTVALNNVSRIYSGTTDIALSSSDFTASGMLDGDSVVIIAGTADFDTKDVGTGKTVTASGVSVGSASNGSMAVYGYDVVSTNVTGTGDVTPKSLTITATNATRTEGESNPSFNANFNGFVAGEDQSVLNGSLAFNTTANESSGAGTYSITPAGFTSSNYAITYQAGTLTVSPAAQQPEVPEVPEVPEEPEVPEVPNPPQAPSPSPSAEGIGHLVQAPNPGRVTLAAADRTIALREPTARSMIVDGGISLGAAPSGATPAQSTVWGGFISAEPLDVVQLTNNAVTFQLPQETFRHSNAQENVQVTAQLAGGGPLPPSLHFDPQTGVLSGTLPADQPALSIVFIARDTVGGEASTRLELRR